MYAIVCQIAVLQELRMSAGTIGEVPLVNNLAMVVDEIDSAGTGEVREEYISWRNLVWIDASKAESTTSKCALFHVGGIKNVERGW